MTSPRLIVSAGLASRYPPAAPRILNTIPAALSCNSIALSELGEYRDVIKYSDIILSIDENNVDALNQKGLAHAKLEENQEAMKYIDRVLSIDENNVGALSNKGVVYGYDGEYTEAMKYLKKALSIEDSGNTRKAIEYFIKKQNQHQKENATTKSENNDEKPRWTSEPATNAQRQLIKKLGGDENSPKTKGEASEMITKLLSQKK